MNRRLAQRLAAVESPVFVVSDQRELIFCNPACADWLGVEGDELIGHLCEYRTPATADPLTAAAAALSPPPVTFTGELTHGVISHFDDSGKSRSRTAIFIPLGDEEDNCGGVVGVMSLSDGDVLEIGDIADTETSDLHRKLQQIRREFSQRFDLAQLVGESPAAQRIRQQVRLASIAPTRVLVVGPEGSGREHVARTIHHAEHETDAPPIVPLSCALLDAELVQTTVTAFVRSQAGVKSSRPAAMLLLEVDQLPPDAQAELAGFLNLPSFELHLLTTARSPLMQLADAGKYRRDLAFALSTLVIELPALADRREDIPLLAQSFVEKANTGARMQHSGFSPEALDRLAAYDWPENLNELAAAVRQAHLAADAPEITVDDLPPKLKLAAAAAAHPGKKDEKINLDQVLEEVESDLLERALARAHGNKTKAASLLGITRSRFTRRLTHFGLDEETDS